MAQVGTVVTSRAAVRLVESYFVHEALNRDRDRPRSTLRLVTRIEGERPTILFRRAASGFGPISFHAARLILPRNSLSASACNRDTICRQTPIFRPTSAIVGSLLE